MLKISRNIALLTILMVLCFSASVFANGGGYYDENYQIDEMTGQGAYYVAELDKDFEFEIELKNFDPYAWTIDVKGEMEADKILLPIQDEYEDADYKLIIPEQTALVGEYFVEGPYGAGFIFLAYATPIVHVGKEDIYLPTINLPLIIYDGDQLGEGQYLGQFDYFGIFWGQELDDEMANGNVVTTWEYLEP